MTLARLAWRSLASRPLATGAAWLGLALGAALVVLVLSLRREAEETFTREAGIIDLVVGAKGSPLQLTLSAIYHLDAPTGNIPHRILEDLRADRRVALAVPVGLGDNYRGFRVVGTGQELFELRDRQSREPLLSIGEGRSFNETFEAVLGSVVARETGLGPGDTFVGSHGLAFAPGADVHGSHPYTVTGILAPTGTSQDRAIFVPLESVWEVHEPADGDRGRTRGLRGLVRESPPAREVTAVLVQLHAPGMRLWVADEIRKNTEAMAAVPVNEMLRFSRRVLAPVQRALLAVAAVVVVVAALTVLATLTLAVERRRRDLAVFRCLGAHRREILLLVLCEAGFLGLGGMVTGWLLAHGGMAVAAPMIRARTGLRIDAWATGLIEWQALGLILAAALLAGLAPALLSYRRPPLQDLGSQG